MNASPAMKAALEQIEALGTRDIDLIRAASFRRQQRTKRRERVNEYMKTGKYGALLTWLSEPSPIVGGFMSTDEARRWLRKEIVRILTMRRFRGADYYGFRDNVHRLPGLRPKPVV